MKYSPAEVAAFLRENAEQIRVWSVEFAAYLSPSAAPEQPRKHRSYTSEDVAVLAVVADYKNRSLPFPAIHKALSEGERLIPAIAPSGQLIHQDKTLALQNRITELETDLAKEKATRQQSDEAKIVSEGQVALLERQLAESRARAEELVGENAVLKYRLSQDKGSE